MDKVPKKKILLGNFSWAVFSVLDFLTLEDGTDMLSQNVRNYHSMLHNISEEQRSHMTIWQCRLWFWLHVVRFRVIWYGATRFGASYVNFTFSR